MVEQAHKALQDSCLETNVYRNSKDIVWNFSDSAGASKSALINAVLGMKLAHESSLDVGTLAPTEFVHSDQSGIISVDVLCHPRHVIDELIKKAFTNVYRGQKFTEDSEGPDKSPDVHDCYTEGITFFEDILRDTVHFSTREHAEHFFSDAHSEDDPTKLEILRQMVRESMNKILASGGPLSFTAANETQFRAQLAKAGHSTGIMTDEQCPTSLWPVVEKIRISCDSPILKGRMLVDSPGTGETNRNRMAAAFNHQQSADKIVVVQQLERAATSPELREHLRRLHRMGRLDDAIVVLTKADGVLAEVERKEALLILLSEEESLSESLKRHLEQPHSGDCGSDQFEWWKTQDNQLRERLVRARLETCEARSTAMKKVLQPTIEALRRLPKELTNDADAPDLLVLAVSNTMYWDSLGHRDDTNPPAIVQQATGVPRLLQEIEDITTSRKHQALRRYCEDELPSLVSSLELLCQSSKSEHTEAAEIAVREFRPLWEGLVDDLVRRPKKHFADTVSSGIRHNRDSWKGAVRKKWSVWQEYSAQRFRGFVIATPGGRYRVKQSIPGRDENHFVVIDWNEEIQSVCAPDILRDFDTFFIRTGATNVRRKNDQDDLGRFGTRAYALFTRLEARYSTQFKHGPLDPLSHAVSLKKRSVFRRCESLFKKLRSHGTTIQTNATHSMDNPQSFVGGFMQDAYDRAADKKGKGCVNERKNIVGRAMTGNYDCIDVVQDRTQEEFDKRYRGWETLVGKDLGSVPDEILEDLHKLSTDVDSTADVSPQTKEFRQELFDCLQRAKARLGDELQELLDQLSPDR